MSSLRIVLLTLLASQSAAFQPLATRAFSASPLSITRQQSTLLSAFKTKDVQANSTESKVLVEPLLSSSYRNEALEQEKQIVFPSDETTLDLSNEIQDDNALEGLFWRGSVVLLCALWASNFPVAKLVMAEPGVDSSLYAVTRFGLAALALTPGAVASSRRTGMDWETFKGAVVCGSCVAFGYLGQTLGLMTTTASKSCVICTLHCVFVAIVAEWMRVNNAKETTTSNTDFNYQRLTPAAIAVAGVAVVELKGAAGGANIGDLFSAAQPIGFGLGYLLLEDLMAKRPDTALTVSAIKLAVVSLASFAMFELTPLIKDGADAWTFAVPDISPILASPVALGGILYTGLVTTALALWVESKAFVRVPATDASLILTTEPLFAASLGAYTLGETFGLSDYAGASLIIGACALAIFMDDEDRDEDCKPTDDGCQLPRSTPFIE